MTALTLSPGPLADAVRSACGRLDAVGFADILTRQQASAWPIDAETQRAIATRLGWVRALEFITPLVPRLRTFSDRVRASGVTDVVLLGMGGSSLAPEVLRQTLGVAAGAPRFRMLDSVDPDEVRAALARAATTLFLLASKSGSTIEPNAMAAEARRRVEAAGHRWGDRVVAITDEGTSLHALATRERFSEIFVNPSDIGGRYSALSCFGMVPAALMGADLDAILADAGAMASACRPAGAGTNPGLSLGAFMAAGALDGRDKLTLLLPARVASLGLWIEQLVAESTGKRGVGIVPVGGEDVDAPIGDDRLLVAVTCGGEGPDAARLARFAAAGTPAAHVSMPRPESIGAEFYRWEVATAAAGLLLGINPFDEPNVQQAKDATRVLLDAFAAQGRWPERTVETIEGIELRLSPAAAAAHDGAAGSLSRLTRRGDYVGLLAYLPPSHDGFARALARVQREAAHGTGCATVVGYGPRYLHSTGQLHKGGPDTGVFVVITAAGAEDLAVPGAPYSFGALETAQALGDFESLSQSGRRAIHAHLPDRDPARLERLPALLLR